MKSPALTARPAKNKKIEVLFNGTNPLANPGRLEVGLYGKQQSRNRQIAQDNVRTVAI